jgi:hypothetical protein
MLHIRIALLHIKEDFFKTLALYNLVTNKYLILQSIEVYFEQNLPVQAILASTLNHQLRCYSTSLSGVA